MKKINWPVVGVISIVVVLLLFGGGLLIGSGNMLGSVGAYGRMGSWGSAPYGWLGMLLMWLIPLGLIALTVFGVVWLLRKDGNSTPPSA
jgi:uncharacterized membrane protein